MAPNWSIESDVPQETRRHLPNIFEAAIALVHLYPPTGYENNLFIWSADRRILQGKAVSIVMTTSRNPAIQPLIANSNTPNMDAFIMAPMNVTKKTMSIVVVLLVDKIFFDSSGREFRHGFAKLVLALAHEIYGNVQHFLEFDIAGAKAQTMADRVNMERKAYRASLLFLGGLPDHPEYLDIPEGTRAGLMSLLPGEIRGYKSWMNAHPNLEPDPACEAMLEKYKESD
jgi:hypothetical protein